MFDSHRKYINEMSNTNTTLQSKPKIIFFKTSYLIYHTEQTVKSKSYSAVLLKMYENTAHMNLNYVENKLTTKGTSYMLLY